MKPGDILVGKITPKGETQLSPEEKLLRAIFGEKAGDVRDTSLRVPPGVEGTVIDAKVFTRKGAEKDHRSQHIEEDEVLQDLIKDRDDEIRIISETREEQDLRTCSSGRSAAGKLMDPKKKKTVLKKGEEITEEILEKISLQPLERYFAAKTKTLEEKHPVMFDNLGRKVDLIEAYFEEKMDKLKAGDELPPGVIKMVKVYIAIKRSSPSATRWPAATATRASCPGFFPKRICPSSRTGPRWISS